MPHPIQNTQTNLNTYVYYYTNGVQANYGINVGYCGVTERPASIKNPKIKGFRMPSSWYATVHRWTISDGDVTWTRNVPGVVYRASGNMSGFSSTDARNLAVLDPNLADDVLRKALSGLLENDVAFNAFLLQGKQALSMVANLATGLAHGTDKLMTSEFRSPKNFKRFLLKAGDQAIRKFSGKYLEFLYGWKPLADDVENAFQFMIDGYTGPEAKRFRVVVRKSKKYKMSVDFDRLAGMYYTDSWLWRQTLSKENRAKVVLHYQFPNQAGEMLPAMTPFGTAWELAPWSFVVDWFIPVGDWIGAMEATQYAMYMERAILTQSVKVASQPGSGSGWLRQYGITGYTTSCRAIPQISGQSFKMTREVLTKVAVLDRIKFPPFSSKFGLPQASQALALLQQVLNKWS